MNNDENQKDKLEESIRRFIHNNQVYSGRKMVGMQEKSKIKSPNIRYKPEDISRWLQNPVQNEDKLRTLSNYLYDTNPMYKWVITTISGLPKYNWKLTQNSITSKKSKSQRKNTYYEALEYVDKLNIEHEFIKVFLIMLKEDWYYGYEMETDDGYWILPLNASYCKPSSRNMFDGSYNFKFNFSFFDDKKELLSTYPNEFKVKYEMASKNKDKWIELDSNSTICLKFNDEFEYTMPYYAVLFNALLNLDYYQEIKKDRAANENTQIIYQEIPINKDGLNEFAIDLDTAMSFGNLINQQLPDNIMMITSPMKPESIKTERSNTGTDYVDDAYRDFYTNSGLPQHLSNSSNNTAIGLDKAIVVNEQLIFRFYRQIERIVTRKLRHKFPTIKFKFKLLDTTSFNQSKVTDMLLKLAQNGMPQKLDTASSFGKSPYEFFNDLELEEGVFNLTELMKPLQTSHTQSGDESNGGAPTKDDGELTESGQKSRERESDANKKAKK